MGLTSNIALEWDLWIGPFRAFFVTSDEDRIACQKLSGGSASSTAPNPQQLLVACQDTRKGRLVACLNMGDAKQQAGDSPFSFVPETYLEQATLLSDLSFENTYLDTPALPVLLSHCFVETLKAGGLCLLMTCDPGHYSIYKRLGMRPVGGLQKNGTADFQIPMIGLPDLDYLSIIHSPLLPMLRGIRFDRYKRICEWYYQLVRDHKELQIGGSYFPEDQNNFKGHHLITEGLSEAGRKALLSDAIVITCGEGETLIKENDGGKSFGYVRKGLVRIEIKGQPVVLLGEGDIFGEIAFILHTKRSAQVISASSETEVVLFRESAIDHLELESDRTVLWRNLAQVLAQRVVMTNKMLT